jgi:SAM-dependent methyltransferase
VKQYPREYQEHSSYGSCVRLLERSGVEGGVVLDLGCGRSPVAEVLRDKGYEYVGTDVDHAALDDVASRGFDVHPLSLTVPPDDLAAAIKVILGDRRLAAVLALDVLEHLEFPDQTLRAVASVASAHPGAQLVVSIPNVTHVDVGAKLLLGRWDLTGTGLLDDTHLRFFNERLVDELLGGSGWEQVDADDVDLEYSDQRFPADAPVIRPGVPARELLLRLRRDAAAHATTYQFVRRCTVAPAAPTPMDIRDASERGEFITVFVQRLDDQRLDDRLIEGKPRDALLADLDGQTASGVEVVVLDGGASASREQIAGARGRYVTFLEDNVRLSPTWLEQLQRAEEAAPSHLLVSGAVALAPHRLAGAAHASFAELVAHETATPQLWMDVAHADRPGALILASHAVPTDALSACGIGPDPALGAAAAAVMLLRAAELCGVHHAEEVTVAVADDQVLTGAHQVLLAAPVLDASPWVLPPGSFSRVASLRDELVASRAAERAALEAAAASAVEAEALRHHVHRLGGEVEALNEQLEQAARAGGVKRVLGKVATMLASRRGEAGK